MVKVDFGLIPILDGVGSNPSSMDRDLHLFVCSYLGKGDEHIELNGSCGSEFLTTEGP